MNTERTTITFEWGFSVLLLEEWGNVILEGKPVYAKKQSMLRIRFL